MDDRLILLSCSRSLAREMRCGAAWGGRADERYFFAREIWDELSLVWDWGEYSLGQAFMGFFHGHLGFMLGMGLGIWDGLI